MEEEILRNLPEGEFELLGAYFFHRDLVSYLTEELFRRIEDDQEREDLKRQCHEQAKKYADQSTSFVAAKQTPEDPDVRKLLKLAAASGIEKVRADFVLFLRDNV